MNQPLAAAFLLLFATGVGATSASPQSQRLSSMLGPLNPEVTVRWTTPEATNLLRALRHEMLKGPSLDELSGGDPAAAAAWDRWIQSGQSLGRQPLPSEDGRWMQVNPAFDPLLMPGDKVASTPRGSGVWLLQAGKAPCWAAFTIGSYTADYIRACSGRAPDSPWARVVNADGHAFRAGLQGWNAQQQAQPSAGAIIIVEEGLGDDLRNRLEQLAVLAGPFADGAEAPRKVSSISRPHEALQRPTASEWGGVGLIQTPSARTQSAGSLSVTYSRASPYSLLTVMATPFDWMEAGFRYIDIGNRLYGPEIAGDQSYKDKSIDLKLRLLEEDEWRPAIAAGFRDLGGTGLFAGEYLVASRRMGPLDLSLGIGWGYLGAAGDFSNPLSAISDGFDTRPPPSGPVGGEFNSGFFRGRASLFGGVEYRPGWLGQRDLRLKIELDGNDYQSEPLNNPLPASSRVNYGLSVLIGYGFRLGVSYQRGSQVGLSLTNTFDLARVQAAKVGVTPAEPIGRPLTPPEISPVVFAEQTGWTLQTAAISSGRIVLDIVEDKNRDTADAVDRANRYLHNRLGPEVKQFTYQFNEKGIPLRSVHVMRADWLAAMTQLPRTPETTDLTVLPPGTVAVDPDRPEAQGLAMPDFSLAERKRQQLANAGTTEAPSRPSTKAAFAAAQPDDITVIEGQSAKRFRASLAPDYGLTGVGGPDGLLYSLFIDGDATLHLGDRTWIDGTLRYRLADNYENYKYDAPSGLPRVRTDVRSYQIESNITMPVLQLTHVEQLGPSLFASAYGGYLESMYAGIGGEVLYRPLDSRLAFGVDLNRVRQRDFSQNFALRDYEVTTGHLSVYWDTNWQDILATLRVGQYLAGDKGATLQLARRFSNGVQMGVYATRTDVPPEVFGEGSFDKGMYVTIPLDLLLPYRSLSAGAIRYQPLTRDGGALLERQVHLIGITDARSQRFLKR